MPGVPTLTNLPSSGGWTDRTRFRGAAIVLGAWGFSIIVMTEFMREVPLSLEEAARIDGPASCGSSGR